MTKGIVRQGDNTHMKHYWVKQLAMLKEWESGDIESRWGIEAVGSSKVTTNFLIPAKIRD